MKTVPLIVAMLLLFVGAAQAQTISDTSDTIYLSVPVLLHPVTMHKEFTGVYFDKWLHGVTNMVCEVVNWQLPEPNTENEKSLTYLKANAKSLFIYIGDDKMTYETYKKLCSIPGLTGNISQKIRIKGTLQVWAYKTPGMIANDPSIHVRLISIDNIEK
jgi:hypothetical protein